MPKKTDSKQKAKGGRKASTGRKPTHSMIVVEAKNAFHFYEAVDKPSGETASSLPDFLEKLKTAKLESLLFHSQRDDFSNWIENTLGDAKLASEIEKIRISYANSLRTSIRKALENRVKALDEAPVTVEISEAPPVANQTQPA